MKEARFPVKKNRQRVLCGRVKVQISYPSYSSLTRPNHPTVRREMRLHNEEYVSETTVPKTSPQGTVDSPELETGCVKVLYGNKYL